MSPEQERWAEALAIERQHGDAAPVIIEKRIRALALAGDEGGVARWRDIAHRYDQIRRGLPQ